MSKVLFLPLLAASLLFTSGCALIYKPTGHVLTSLAQDKIVPYALAGGDLRIAACGTGMGQYHLLGSFTNIVGRPAKTMLDLGTLSALCSANKAQEAHLQYVQALNAGQTDEARDARTREQRFWRITTLRRFQAYKDTVTAYGELGDGECPDLDSELDQLQFMVGIVTSVQGILSDIQSASSVGVPQDVAAKAARASKCLDSEQWWGVPQAIRGVVWLSVPGTIPDGKNAWNVLKEAALTGKAQGMPLAAALYIVGAYGSGDLQRQKEGIRWVDEIFEAGIGPTDYLILAEVAFDQALYYSDIIWMEKSGRRTPFQGLGTFPGDKKKQLPEIDVGDFL